MSKKSIFESNVHIWSHTHPKEAVWLPYAEGNPPVPVETKKEAEQWFKSLDLNITEVLYVYGLGLGHYYLAAKKWLDESPNRFLIFLEDDIQVIHRFFETETASKMLNDPKVHLYFFQGIDDAEIIFNRLFWNFNSPKITFSALQYYQQEKKERYDALCYKITYDTAVKNSILEEYLAYGIPFFRNFYPNLLHLASAYSGNALFGKFKNIPAIICGAGPSLAKNVSLLKSLENKALIFAGGSALNALASAGVNTHFGVGIDPNPAQEERLSKLPHLNFPFFYRNRMYPHALNLVKGPKLYITGAGGYDVASWFENKLDIQGEILDEGRNVVNFCIEIANALGCNPIITIGADLAYTDDKKYAPGVLENVLLSKETPIAAAATYEGAVIKTDIHGKPVQTLWKWIAESNWISEYAKQHPDMLLINATEGGLGFPDVPNKTLKQVITKHLKKDHDIQSRIQKQIEKAKFKKVTKSKVLKAVQQLKESLERCSQALEVLITENELVKEEIKKSKKQKEFFQTPKAVLAETELETEEAFTAILQIFNEVSSRLLERELIAGKGKSEKEKSLLRLDLTAKKLHYLKNACDVNIQLIEEVGSVETRI